MAAIPDPVKIILGDPLISEKLLNMPVFDWRGRSVWTAAGTEKKDRIERR